MQAHGTVENATCPHKSMPPNTSPDAVKAVFDLPSSHQTLLWQHASLGFPTKETLVAAVQAGNLSTWPGLTPTTVLRLFPDSIETAKGHLKGQRQGIRSTRQKTLDRLVEKAKNHITQAHEDSPPSNVFCHQDIFSHIEDMSNTIHTDQTCGFPYTSQQGNRYIMVAIHLNANYIFNEPMKHRTEGEIMSAYQRIINRVRAAGLGLKKHILDNEASNAFKQTIKDNGMEYELVPPETAEGIRQKGQSKHSKHISSSSWPASMTSSRSPCGVTCWNQRNSP